MGYTHIFLFFMCVNFGLGITTIADTPLSIPTTYERCYADYTQMDTLVVFYGDDGIDNDGDTSIDEADEQIWGVPAGGMGEDIQSMVNIGDPPTGSIIDPNDPTGQASGTIGTPFDPIVESVEGGYAILVTMKNFIAGGYIADVLGHITLTCNFEGSPIQYLDAPANEVLNPDYNADFGSPIQNEVWAYFLGGIQVIFGFLLALTLFNWLTGRNVDLGS